MSWISLTDAVNALTFLLDNSDANGPVNVTSPNPVTNRTFAKALGAAVRRPACIPVPGALVRVMYGEMGQSLLLDSYRVIPKRLEALGFRFAHPEIEEALSAALYGDSGLSSLQ